jgi:hypothetical protein
MKRHFWVFSTVLVTSLSVAVPNAIAGVCSVGQRGEVLWRGSWYPARVLNVNGNQCYITYESYDSSWDEWVEPQRFRVSFQAGDAVRILWQGQWYPGRVLEIRNGAYHITYDGYDSSWNEWVEPARLSR